MDRLEDVRIVVSNGRRLLRFSATMLNAGPGPFEVRGLRASTSSPWSIDQIVFDDAGGTRRIATPATMNYAGDGHNHWHVSRVVDHDLFSGSLTEPGPKIGFCFFDTTHWAPSIPGSPPSRVYVESSCGGLNALSNKLGISVGWGDRYGWQLPFQWVDVTGLPGGTYTLRSIVDARDEFGEVSNANNCAYTRIRFGSSGTAVTVLGSGETCINDWSETLFAVDIGWAFETGLTTGCGIDLYCPNAAVTRAEMASFLVRGLDLPASTVDAFGDDDASPHEPDINALAAAGIASGCGPGAYCPAAPVSRAQMASFLVRALDLPPSGEDPFSDDEGSVHEADISALAEAGITAGCSPTRYCPSDPVTRGAMAAFLHRALDE